MVRSGLEIRETGRFGLHSHFGVFDASAGTCLFAPPFSASLVLVGDDLLSWRYERLPNTTGKCRADYAWTVELYRWSDKTLLWWHAVLDQETVGGCEPSRISFLEKTDRRIIQLRYSTEDFPGSLYVVRQGPKTVVEHRNKSAALAVLFPSPPAAPPRQRAQPRSAEDPLLEEVLSRPDDDEPRLRYADSLIARGDPRGTFLALQLRMADLTNAERQHEKQLRTLHAAEWGAPLAAIKSGQVYRRGFLISCRVGSAPQDNRARERWESEPLWRLIESLPGNMDLPNANLMDRLEVSLGFNLARWLLEREAPWSRLRVLVAREKELAILDEVRFPRLEQLHLYSWAGLDLARVLSFGPLRSLIYIGRDHQLEDVFPILEASTLANFEWAPHQGALNRVLFSRTDTSKPFAAVTVVTQSGPEPSEARAREVFQRETGVLPGRAFTSIEVHMRRQRFTLA